MCMSLNKEQNLKKEEPKVENKEDQTTFKAAFLKTINEIVQKKQELYLKEVYVLKYSGVEE